MHRAASALFSSAAPRGRPRVGESSSPSPISETEAPGMSSESEEDPEGLRQWDGAALKAWLRH